VATTIFSSSQVLTPPDRGLAWPESSLRASSDVRDRFLRLILIAMVVVAALELRITGLSTYGFSEDEINKVHAIEQYRAGHFIVNAEHPMLMKLAMWSSVNAADAWNRVAPDDIRIAPEAAIRLPNAVAGAAITVVIFGIAYLLFGEGVAFVAAAFWAFDVNAIAINRIGKEDTFLLLFFLIAVYLYERAKQIGVTDPRRAQPWYAASGVSFGLMLASKYMPQYLVFYAIFNYVTDVHPGGNKPRPILHWGAMAATFLACNFVVLSPAMWRYALTYVSGDMQAHHGYLYAGQLYVTDVPVSPLGVPFGYYFALLATKVPLVVLASAVPGVIEMVRRRGERGYVLLRVLLVFLLVPYSLMAAKFMRYSLPMLMTVDLIAAVGLVAGIGWLLRKGWLSPVTRVSVAAAALAVVAVAVAGASQFSAPYYSFFQNAVGARVAPGGVLFPEESYDIDVREAVADIARVAQPNAVIVTDAAAVAQHYLASAHRPDLAVRPLSGTGIPSGPREVWAIVLDEHLTFENALVVEQLRRSQAPWRETSVAGVRAVQIFRIGGQAS